jgi:hypothetical protein
MDQQIADCLERLCRKGCLAVRGDIQLLEQGKTLPETEGLDRREVQLVLKELKSIMAAYGDSCRV